MGDQDGRLPDYDVARSGQAGTAGLAIAAPVKIRVMTGSLMLIMERQTYTV